jgi:signal transduction histidine kinase
MRDASVLDRLAELPTVRDVPRDELVWLVEHGKVETHLPGSVVAPGGEPVDRLFIILSGRIAIRVDRGAGPRLVMEWRTGEVTGMLPYSRMTGPPGDNVAEEPTELIAVHTKHFPEMVSRCPAFTAFTVHLMLDRARSFSASQLQDEKMISLGRLAAGLAHELNNPASAVVRNAKLLLKGLAEADGAARALGGAKLSPEQLERINAVRSACQTKPGGDVLSAFAQATREDSITEWLSRHDQNVAHAIPLADTTITLADLEALAASTPPETLDAVLRWIAAGCTTNALAQDIESAAARIHDLVAAVKKFTYMDNLSAEASVELEPGLRDTARVVASKARAKGVSIELDVEPDLPPVSASGGELNQVWLNLIDNALDAVAESGHVRVEARRALDRVLVSVIDDGPGIPEDVMPKIFDPFFTTKPPGQGTGLGLELTRRLVLRYRGDLTVDSRPGRTEFRVSLAGLTTRPGG